MSYSKQVLDALAETGLLRAPSLVDLVRIDPLFFDRVLSEDAAAEICGRTGPSFQQRRANGTGPVFVKHGRSVRYRVRDLIDWIAADRISGTRSRHPNKPSRHCARRARKTAPTPTNQ